VDALGIGLGGDKPRILIRCLGISTLDRDVVEPFAMLSLIARDHIDGLLEQIKIKVLVG
jgi:hypothetical protein